MTKWKTKRIIVNDGGDCNFKLPMQIRTQQIGFSWTAFTFPLSFTLLIFSYFLSWQRQRWEGPFIAFHSLTKYDSSFLHSVKVDVPCEKTSHSVKKETYISSSVLECSFISLWIAHFCADYGVWRSKLFRRTCNCFVQRVWKVCVCVYVFVLWT